MSRPLILTLSLHRKTTLQSILSDASSAKCDAISGQNKKLKLKYLINKTLERKSTKELVLKF